MVLMSWFEVDKEGLGKLLDKRGKGFAVAELVQNPWDEKDTTRVDVSLTPSGPGYVELKVVDDNLKGFARLTDAFTLFAESLKKKDPTQRGRFNLGEKLVLALCKHAEIASTTGTITFTAEGRTHSRKRTERGSIFTGLIRMNKTEMQETLEFLKTLLPPARIRTTINGMPLQYRAPAQSIEAKLPTEIADSEGFLRRTVRLTDIHVHVPLDGETAKIYEMGIPVVETGDKYHLDIQQKVPLNTDRDNVTPAYLREVRTLAFNAMHHNITEEDANTSWVREATSDERCTDDAMQTAITKRFGAMRVIYDPSDPEANAKAFSQGYTVIKGAQLNKREWSNVHRGGLALPAGQVTPAKPKFTNLLPPIPRSEWTDGMLAVHDYTVDLAKKLMDVDLEVSFIDSDSFSATYSRTSERTGHFTYYLRNLGKAWFDLKNNIEDIDELNIHEFGHQYSSDHLSHEYHKALCMLAARIKRLALDKPEFFRRDHGR